jgi:hypothetical protein
MTKSEIRQAAAALGALGGMAGTGKAKRRSKEHYRLAGIKSGLVRRRNAKTNSLTSKKKAATG